jgi:membrane peptidoglycan carboxypeptidase
MVDRAAGTTIASGGLAPLALRTLRLSRVGISRIRISRRAAGLLLALVAALLVAAELRTSWLQSLAASHFARAVRFAVLGGKNPAVPAPAVGPYDLRLGYDRVGAHARRLEAVGFQVTAQARQSARGEVLAALGLPAIYVEKSRAGLRIEDRKGVALSETLYPARAFGSFEELPPLLVETLLFIENRELLDPGFPYRSPVIEWERLVHAALLQALPRGGGRRPGASTLAIQLEKYRHSPDGLTASVPEKLRQIGAATLRAYHDGPDTRDARRRIVTDYVNTVPLAARPGFGEVHGIPDGLHAWFGADFRENAHALAEGTLEARALAYRRVLSLFLAQRRPSWYLLAGRQDLHALADSYLPLLAEAGVIDPELRDAALRVRPRFLEGVHREPRAPFVERKATDGVRAELLAWLDAPSAYDLDRMDLSVETTLDAGTQERVTALLQELGDPAGVAATLRQPRLLESGDPARVVYGFLLYERVGDANVLRVQADTLDQPFNVNDGMKLDLGSTAKLRTLIHYLEVVAAIWDRYAGSSRQELLAADVHPRDPLTRFVVDALIARPGASLAEIVDVALERRFSATPGRFFTGGGVHPFGNYENSFNGSQITLRTALRHSVNLPFVRLMREITDHLTFGPGGPGGNLLDDPADPGRTALLARFAERESLAFLNAFQARHRELSPLEREAALAARVKGPWKLAVLYRSLHPEGDVDALHRFLARHLPGVRFHGDELRGWHERANPWRLTLADRGWLTGIHPLELWLVAHWSHHPEADAAEVRQASAPLRAEIYQWLFKTGRRSQDLRIRTELERDAFREVHAAWQRTGYPFASLAPSLATALGSSADRPAALAELMGILQNDGLRLPSRRIDAIRLAANTPFETQLRPLDAEPERVLRPEVARAVRTALLDVVENGTARRAHGALHAADGTPLPVGGKTGTGDNRRKRFGPGGRLIEAEVASRSATLAFLVGDRHFGVLTAYVEGPEAGAYAFTSSLPAQVLRLLAPALEPLLASSEPEGMQALRPPPAREPAAGALARSAPEVRPGAS